MGLPIQNTIEDLTPTKIAREMGIPISTVHRWMTEDRIPGKGAAHDWRVAQFEAAAARVRAAREGEPQEHPVPSESLKSSAPAETEVAAMPAAPFPGDAGPDAAKAGD